MTEATAQAAPVSVLDAFSDPNLLGNSFGGETREAWRAVLAGAYALPMDDDRHALFQRLAGGRTAPTQRVRELWAIAGRRSDKTHTAGGLAVYIATIGAAFDGTLAKLSAGERGVVAVIAVDRPQAKVALNYVTGLVEQSPLLERMVVRRTSDGLELNNGTTIEVSTNSHRSVRGRTLLAAILDEAAFYRDERSATPDVELYRALVPSLATTGGMLIGISSPYARKGLLYQKYRKHYGRDGDDVLVVQGASRDFNPTIPQEIIDEADADDPAAALSEWHGQFRSDIEDFVSRDAVEACMRPEPLEIPPTSGERYAAFIDPAGGGADEFTVAIGHREGDSVIVDCVRARRGTPAAIVEEYAALLKSYGVRRATSDKYGGTWPSDEFRRHGITVETGAKAKSDLYVDALAAINSGRIELPPDDRLLNQWVSLERRTARGGKDSVDHPPNAHDDRANAVAGLAQVCQRRQKTVGVHRVPGLM